MKRITSLLALVALLFTGCSHESKPKDSVTNDSVSDTVAAAKFFTTQTIKGELCFMEYGEIDDPDYDTIGYTESFNIQWPDKGMMTDEALRELMRYYFYDSKTTDISKAIDDWRKKVIGQHGNLVRKIDESYPYGYNKLSSTCMQNGNLATFTISYGYFDVGAAHGLYDLQYLTVDVDRGTIIHLSDLIDTTHLDEVIARALQDVVANDEVRYNLFDEYQNCDRMPITLNFYIDDTRSTIHVIYGLYEVAPYCNGLTEIVLPIYWLSKHVKLTPYAKEIFGPGSYLE